MSYESTSSDTSTDGGASDPFGGAYSYQPSEDGETRQLNYDPESKSGLKARSSRIGVQPSGELAAAIGSGIGSLAGIESGPASDLSRKYYDPGMYGLGSGTTYNQIKQAKSASGGNFDVSGTQTADQALGADAAHQFLNKYMNPERMIGLIGGPLVGLIASFAGALTKGQSTEAMTLNAMGSLLSPAMSQAAGMQVSPSAIKSALSGDAVGAITFTAKNAVAKELGIPASSVDSALKGDMGTAVANAASSAFLGTMAERFGTNPAFIKTIASSIPELDTVGSDFTNSVKTALNDTWGSFGNMASTGTAALSSAFSGVGSGGTTQPTSGGTQTAGLAAVKDEAKTAEAAQTATPGVNTGLLALAAGLKSERDKTAAGLQQLAEAQKRGQDRGPVELFSSDIFAGRRGEA